MPRIRPRKFFEHTGGEIHQLQRIHTFLFMMVAASWSMTRLQAVAGVGGRSPSLAGFSLHAIACLGMSTVAAVCACTPCTRLRAPTRPQQLIDEVHEMTFRTRYRFRRAHVWQILQAVGLLDNHGKPVLLQVGHSNNQLIWADTALLIVLRRLAHAMQWDYLTAELGCSRALLSAAFIYLVDYLHDGYAARLNTLGTWAPDFPAFASHIQSSGSLFANTVGFVDGHFKSVCRPGGAQNAFHSVLHQDLYSGYYKTHCLKYLCVVLPNGILLAHGAWRGR
jgi:hypothetical protein